MYSLCSRVLPVFRVFPCIPVYYRYSRYSVYSLYSRYSCVFPCIPCIPCVFPCIPVYSRIPRAPARPLSPEARSCAARGDRGGGAWYYGVPRCGMSRGVPQGYTPGPATTRYPVVPCTTTPGTARCAGTGLWAQSASQGAGGHGVGQRSCPPVPVSSVDLARYPDHPQGDLG